MTRNLWASKPVMWWLNEDPFANPPEESIVNRKTSQPLMNRWWFREDEAVDEDDGHGIPYPSLKTKPRKYAHNPQECGDYCCHYEDDGFD